jgi:hypothetical protein
VKLNKNARQKGGRYDPVSIGRHFDNPSIRWRRTGSFASPGYPGFAFSVTSFL